MKAGHVFRLVKPISLLTLIHPAYSFIHPISLHPHPPPPGGMFVPPSSLYPIRLKLDVARDFAPYKALAQHPWREVCLPCLQCNTLPPPPPIISPPLPLHPIIHGGMPAMVKMWCFTPPLPHHHPSPYTPASIEWGMPAMLTMHATAYKPAIQEWSASNINQKLLSLLLWSEGGFVHI